MIKNDNENTHPRFKEYEKDRKYFDNADEVLNFWKKSWCKQDPGKPGVQWLDEYVKLFESQIPEVNVNNLVVTLSDTTNAIKKKRNWSSPGPDLVTNFWLKKLVMIHEPMTQVF